MIPPYGHALFMVHPSQKRSTNNGIAARSIAAIEAGTARISRLLNEGPAKPQAPTKVRLATQTKNSEVWRETPPLDSIAIA